MTRQQQITDTLTKYPEALASQGGGLVIWNEEQLSYVFVLPPDNSDFLVGDFMPDKWGTAPTSMAT